jgi:hypothetical protein
MIQNICRSRQTQYWLSIFVLVHNSCRTLASMGAAADFPCVWLGSGGSGAEPLRLRSSGYLDGERRERSSSRENIPTRCEFALSLKIRGTEPLRSRFSSPLCLWSISYLIPPTNKRGSKPLQPNISTKHVKGWSHPQNKGWLHSAPLPLLSNQTHDGGLRAGGNELWDKQSWIFHKGKMVMSRLPNFLQIGRKCQGYMGVFDKT